MSKPVMLIILDGFGLAPAGPGNAVHLANTPNFDTYWSEFPHTQLEASGLAVGLPKGQMGNSEVGHMNIGAGRVVAMDLGQIDLQGADVASARSRLAESLQSFNAFGMRAELLGCLEDCAALARFAAITSSSLDRARIWSTTNRSNSPAGSDGEGQVDLPRFWAFTHT